MIKNILLTGGTGFLGSNILRKLVEQKYNVIVLARENSDIYRIENLIGRFEFFYINKNSDNIDEFFKKHAIDTIIHTATEYGRNSKMSSILESNLIFPIKLVESGKLYGLKHFINSDTFFGKESFKDLSYLTEYTVSKKYFLDYLISESKNLKIVNMRLEHIFGALDSESKFVTSILRKLINNDQEILLTDGLQRRDFIFIDDVVDAYLIVIQKINKVDNFTEFEIGNGKSTSVRQFVQILWETSKSNSNLKFGALPTRIGEIQDSVADIEKLGKIGWIPNYDLKTAICKMFDIEVEVIKNK